MNKHDFLNRLTYALSGIPQEERRKTIDYYSEIIDDAVEEGEDEQTVIARLGNIDNIAEKIINETPIHKFVKEDVKNHNITILNVVLIILSLPIWFPILTAVIVILFSLYITLWSIVVSFFAVFASIALAGIALFITSPFMLFVRPIKAMLAFGTALICIGLSVFIFYLSVWSAKLLIKLTVFCVRKIKDIFIKKGSGAVETK